MWFDSWSDVIRTVVIGAAAYVTVIVVLRVSGKRTLSQLNAFNLVVTVAVGSTLATILLNNELAWAEGAAALALLASLQFILAWSTSRWRLLRSVVTASPRVLLHNGAIDPAALRSARLTEAELRQAVRSTGAGDLSDIAVVVLETNGKFSVISHARLGGASALEDLRLERNV